MKGRGARREPGRGRGGTGGGGDREPASGPVSFVILLWLEPREGSAEPEWRWRVRQAQSGEEACFRRLGDLLAYITSRTGLPAPG